MLIMRVRLAHRFQFIEDTVRLDDALKAEKYDLVLADVAVADQLSPRVSAIAEIQSRRSTQSQAALLLGIDQPKVPALKHGKLSGFVVQRGAKLLTLVVAIMPPCATHKSGW